VESASIQGEGDVIHEIHVLTRSNRSPKQIVRDVQAVLHNRFKRSIDYPVLCVAYLSSDPAKSDHGSGNGITAASVAPEPITATAQEAPRPAVAKMVEPAPVTLERPAPMDDQRIR